MEHSKGLQPHNIDISDVIPPLTDTLLLLIKKKQEDQAGFCHTYHGT